MCVCAWTHAAVSVLILSQSERSRTIPQKPQYRIVNIQTHARTHTHQAVTLRSPVNSLQCLLSPLCRHKPKRQCCVQLILLFRLCWHSYDFEWAEAECVCVCACVRVWLSHLHFGVPLEPPPPCCVLLWQSHSLFRFQLSPCESLCPLCKTICLAVLVLVVRPLIEVDPTSFTTAQ